MLHNEITTEFQHLVRMVVDSELKSAENMDKQAKMYERMLEDQRRQFSDALAVQGYKRVDEKLDLLSKDPAKMARAFMAKTLEDTLEELDAVKEERDALKEQNATVSPQIKVQCKKASHPLKHFSFIHHRDFYQHVTQSQILARLELLEDEIEDLKADRKKKAQKAKKKKARMKKVSVFQQPSNASPGLPVEQLQQVAMRPATPTGLVGGEDSDQD